MTFVDFYLKRIQSQSTKQSFSFVDENADESTCFNNSGSAKDSHGKKSKTDRSHKIDSQSLVKMTLLLFIMILTSTVFIIVANVLVNRNYLSNYQMVKANATSAINMALVTTANPMKCNSTVELQLMSIKSGSYSKGHFLDAFCLYLLLGLTLIQSICE
jgi:hypothetical protein